MREGRKIKEAPKKLTGAELEAAESKMTLKEAYRRLQNYKNSIYGGRNSISLKMQHASEDIEIEVTDFLGNKWTHSGLKFANWHELEVFLEGYDEAKSYT